MNYIEFLKTKIEIARETGIVGSRQRICLKAQDGSENGESTGKTLYRGE